MLTHRHGLTVWLLISFVALLFAQISFSPFAFAADRFVGTMPGDYPSIKDALDAAADGDRVILRQGTYSEDVIIDKPGIQLVPEMGAAVTLDGNITLTSAAGGSDISGIEMSDGKSIVVEDGISWPVSLPVGTESRVVMIASGSDGFDITLGDVTANAGFDSVMGAYIFTGEHSEVRHEGEIVVESSADSSSARGASIVMGANAEATFDRVEAQAGRVAIGVHFFTSNDGELTVTGDVVAHARDFDSSATGVGVRGQTNVSAALGDIDVEGGSRAVGIDFNVTDNGILTHSGDVVVSARDAASAAYGVTLGAGDGFLATIENVAVDAGLLARGVTTTYDTIVGTEGIANDADIHIVGGVFVTARDVDSEAYGVDLEGEGNVSLSVRDVAVEGGRLARGIWLQTAGDGGNLSHVGDVSTTARDSGSQAYGVDVAVGNNFASTVGSVLVSAPGLARAVYFTGGHNGSLVIEGDLSATSSAGATHGMLVDAGDQFQASVRNVQVEGGGNAIQGVALNVGSGGSLSQEGLIEVKGTSASSNVRGVNVLAQEGFSASIDNVAVEGLRSALGVYWLSTDGARLIHTGAISATATDASASAAGASIVPDTISR